MAASPEHLLAMKVMAARQIQDAGDIRFLVERMGLPTAEAAVQIVGEVFPDQPISARARLLLEDIFERMHEGGETNSAQ
jgi:hypothetical protein